MKGDMDFAGENIMEDVQWTLNRKSAFIKTMETKGIKELTINNHQYHYI
jgi:5S rRNA maturation endonuclease (ribonuclease M5)